MEKIGTGRPDEAARRAAEEAARRRAAEAAAKPAIPARPGAPLPRPAAGDAQGLGANTALEAQAGPRGAAALPSGPKGAAAADFDGFDGFDAPGVTTAEARAFVQDSLRALDGPPAQAVQAAAALLGDPRKFADALKQLATLRGTPEGAAVKAELDQVVAKATPAAIAAKLAALGDPAALPAETLQQLGRLRALPDPALQAALDQVAMKLLPTLTPERLARDESLSALVAPLEASANPQAKAALAQAVTGWTKAALDRALAGKQDAAGVEQGIKAFQSELIGLARATGLGGPLQAAAQQVVAERAPELEKIAAPKPEKKGLWGRITGAVSGVVEGVSNVLGNTLKFAVDGIGKVAKVAIDVTAKVSTVGLDLSAAVLDAVGADGAAAKVREADRMVEKAYAAVGNQVDLFAQGVGSAFRDTVTGIGSTIAHPIETVKGIAHLVTHPGEIVTVAKTLWDTATEKGPAYALGYVAGNLLPMVLSGGSSTGGTLGARVGAIAGNSRIAQVAKASKLVQGASKVAGGAAKAVSASRAGQLAARGFQATAKVAGNVRTFVSKPAQLVGKVAAESQMVQRAVGFVKATAAQVGESGAGRALKRLASAYEDKVVALNDLVDGGLRKAVNAADNAVLGVEKQVVRGPRAVADAAKVQRAARELTEADRKLLERHGKSLEEVEDLNTKGLGKNKDPNQDNLIKAATPEADQRLKDLKDGAIDRNRKVYDQDPMKNLEKVGANRVEDGVIYQGARPNGEMPNVRVNYRNPKLRAAMDEAKAVAADATLSAEQKIQKITDLVRGKDGQPGLLQAASTNEVTDAWFNQFNAKMKGADFRLAELDDYLNKGIGDCRHFAITNQTLLQELEQAIPGLNPRVVYTATFETVENGKALAVNHAFNVVTIGGEDIVVDAILPHFTGGKVKDYVEKGIFGREVRFVNDRFQTQAGRWIKGGENVGTAFNTDAIAPVAAGQLQNAQERR